jgi:hypothetical protein
MQAIVIKVRPFFRSIVIMSLIAAILIVPGQTAEASLRRTVVRKGSSVAKELGLVVEMTRDEHVPDVPTIVISARSDGLLGSLFHSGLRVGEERHGRVTSMLLDVPLDVNPIFARKAEVRFTLRLHESMLRSATVYLRCGTTYSEELYEIKLADYVPTTARK